MKHHIEVMSLPPIQARRLAIGLQRQYSLAATSTNKPTLIILYGVEDVNKLTNLIETVSNRRHFFLKLMHKNLLRILIDSAEEYKKTYQPHKVQWSLHFLHKVREPSVNNIKVKRSSIFLTKAVK